MSGLQRKLSIGSSDDPLEHEADRVAEQVLSAPVLEGGSWPVPAIRRFSPRSKGPGEEAPASAVKVLGTSGKALDGATRRYMEERFGRDFSRVRVHHDVAAAESALELHAHAYTVGNHIAFGAGRFSPGSAEGRRLLAHELTHVLQQQASLVGPGLQRRAEPDYQSGPSLREPSRPETEDNAPSRKKRNKASRPGKGKADAPKESKACAAFPGGDTDCELDANGVPTGKILVSIAETNPCTRPCVELHENVHVRQLTTFCPDLRDCWNQAEKGARDLADCWKMGMFGGGPKRECPAYQASAACLEKRLASAPECQSEPNRSYGKRKLETSEICFRDKNCGARK